MHESLKLSWKNQILTLCLLSAQTGAVQLKVETTATQPELSSEAKPATTLAPSSGGGGTTNSITSSVSLSDQKNPTEKSDQKVATIENSASAAPCALPTTNSLSEKKPLTPNANELHDFDGRNYFSSYSKDRYSAVYNQEQLILETIIY